MHLLLVLQNGHIFFCLVCIKQHWINWIKPNVISFAKPMPEAFFLKFLLRLTAQQEGNAMGFVSIYS